MPRDYDALISAPEDKRGWPWTVQDDGGSNTGQHGSFATSLNRRTSAKQDPTLQWPRVTIVTPSYNQAQFIEETIRSVLLQGYPNLEYFVIDGGSTDGSVDIIRKYEPWVDYWVSERDRGQSHAINKGFSMATGEILGWLNSDDLFMPGALFRLMNLRARYPRSVAWVGACRQIAADGSLLGNNEPHIGQLSDFINWGVGTHFYQPSCLFRRDSFERAGGLNENLSLVMDVDLWIRLSKIGAFASSNEVISSARIHPNQKTGRDVPMQKCELISLAIKHGMPDAGRQLFVDFMHRKRRAAVAAVRPVEILRERTLAEIADVVPFKSLLKYCLLRAYRTFCRRTKGNGVR